MTWGRDQQRASFRLSVSDRFSASSFILWLQSQQLCITYSDIFCICPDFPPSSRFSYSDMRALSFRIYALWLIFALPLKKKKKKKRITGLIILESLSISKEMQPVNPKGSQSWIFIGKTVAKSPVLWSPDAKSRPIGKDPDARKDWRWEGKGMAKDEMVGWHHWLKGHESEQTPR